MALHVEDPQVGALADRLAAIKGVSTTEAVRQALQKELDSIQAPDEMSRRVREALEVVRALHAKHPPTGQVADKAWIDSLYEDD
ncbi:type II toxin-antitoxin system VapB family antitoxin [Aureimonas glaciei]|jgi:antitoxin VapB|uniref:Transcription factor n=1 Tax=Aureimonas glaciei TaxID=1776957 RepID=A0A917D9L9_9HYPH|nr:type II toxin-antitoxin system VapB family antitoxin [Aureimonas glaciei]GGD13870.1 hypothetical protein GCM10011335_15800 [Aureimonas glaciei]